MKIKLIIYSLMVICLNLLNSSVILAQGLESHNQYQRLIIFGDSYSDNGNVYKLTNQTIPNGIRYWQGRFSEGPSWGEYFAKNLAINPDDNQRFIDFAYGGAKITQPVNEVIHGYPKQHYIVPNLSQQIDAYLKLYNKFNENDLVVVFMGTNDFTPLFHKDSKFFFPNLADLETNQVDRLIQNGAHNIIVFNVRNLTYTPVAQLAKNDEIFGLIDKYLVYLNKSINSVNARLSDNLKSRPQVFLYNIYDFDTMIFNQMKKNGYNYDMDGKANTLSQNSVPCYKNYKGNYQTISGKVCANPKAYFFYDRIHTTSAVNYLLAKDVYRQFSQKTAN